MVNTKATTSNPTAAANKRKKGKTIKTTGKNSGDLSPVDERESSAEQRDSSGDERCSKKCEREDADVTCDDAATKTSRAVGKKRRAPCKSQARSSKGALSPVEEKEGSVEPRFSSTSERADVDASAGAATASKTSRADGMKRRAPSKSHAKPSLGRLGSDEVALQMLSAPTGSFDVSNIMNLGNSAHHPFPSLSSDSFGGLSFTGVPAAESNMSNTVDLGEPLASMSMSQDQAWEILNQDSFGFNLGQGTLSLSFSHDEENLALPSPRMENRVNELTMDNALDGTSEDLKKSIDLTSAVTESIDGPSTPGKTAMETSIPKVATRNGTRLPEAATSDGKAKLNPFFPHGDFEIGHIPPTPPSTQSAPLASTLPRKRDSRDDRQRSRHSDRRSFRDGLNDCDCYPEELSFRESKSEDYYYDRPRHRTRSSGGKRSGTRSSSRRHREHAMYHRSGEPLSSGSPPPLPNMGSAPSPRTRDDDMMGAWAPDSKRYRSSSGSSRPRASSRSDKWAQEVRSRSSTRPGALPPFPPTTASHQWHPGPIRPSARYPQSPSNAAKGAAAPASNENSYKGPNPMYSSSDVRPQSGKPAPPPMSSMSPPSMPMKSHPHPAPHPGFPRQNLMNTCGYPYATPPPHHVMNNHPPRPGGSNGDYKVHRAFLPPPPPQFTNKTSEPASSNAPPREVYILSSTNGIPGNPNPPPFRQPAPGSSVPPHSLPPAHGRGPYHPYHPVPSHLPQPGLAAAPRAAVAPPQQGSSLLGSLTREQAPGIGWPQDEDLLLTECMANQKSPVDWGVIAQEHGRGRTPRECHDRWTRYLKPGARKGQWREEEDAIVLRVIAQSAEPTFTQWADLAPSLPGRSGKQIRDRWVNYLNPAINHLPFNREDDLRLWEGHNKLGKRWVEISVKVFNSTRSENHIKNRWYSAAFKKFIANEFGPNAYVDAKAGE